MLISAIKLYSAEQLKHNTAAATNTDRQIIHHP